MHGSSSVPQEWLAIIRDHGGDIKETYGVPVDEIREGIRHGVRNLYDTNENVIGGAKHLRYLLDRFHGNIRLALAAYNAGERKVDRYGQIPPYKETQDYVKKVLLYYRSYKKEGWIMPVVMTTPSAHAGQPY